MTEMFLYLLLSNLTNAIVEFFLIYSLCLCFGERIASKKKTVILCITAPSILGFLSVMFTMNQIQTNGFFFFTQGILFFHLVINIIQTMVLKQVFQKTPRSFLFLIVTVVSALVDLCSITTETLEIFQRGLEASASYAQRYFIRVPFFMITFILIYGLIWLCQKSKIIYVVKTMMGYPKACIFTALVMILSKLVSLRVFSNARSIGEDGDDYSLYLLFMAVVIIMVILLIRSYISELKRKELKLVIGQQTDYLKRLEELQKKLRVIHHDYKNVAAGLYLTAETGDVEAVKSYVNHQLLMMDQEIQMEIRQMNQLINIKDIELKSLFLTKITSAKEEDIIVEIEVSDSVGTIDMPVEDLLRCTGILLDNAIEEAAAAKDRVVKVFISKDRDIIVILIKNRFEHEISLNNIFKQGYSSKGEGRGLGLYSLKEILKKYQNIFLETKLEDGWFVQIIKIT